MVFFLAVRSADLTPWRAARSNRVGSREYSALFHVLGPALRFIKEGIAGDAMFVGPCAAADRRVVDICDRWHDGPDGLGESLGHHSLQDGHLATSDIVGA